MNLQMTRTDYCFLALIILGLVLGLGFVWLEWGWHDAVGYAAVVCVGVGVFGGLRR